MPDGTTYVRIDSITDRSPAAVRALLVTQAQEKPTALIVDLRGCPGGSFPGGVATAGLFLPPGRPIAKLRHRAEEDETVESSGGPILPELPVSVLIDGNTASACELIAATLKEQLGAVLVGATTQGKRTLQTMQRLSNNYAVKYTVARFAPALSGDFTDRGLTADLPVDAPTKNNGAFTPEALQTDPVFAAAHRILAP